MSQHGSLYNTTSQKKVENLEIRLVPKMPVFSVIFFFLEGSVERYSTFFPPPKRNRNRKVQHSGVHVDTSLINRIETRDDVGF
jgi:hypothetical protein